MKKRLVIVVGAIAALFVVSTAGYSWNYATHAYIAGKLATLQPVLKMNQVYGIMAPDFLNLDFSLMDDALLRSYTHGVPPQGPGGLKEGFMAVWRKADGPFQLADAAGYLAHNDAWGADYIAHWMAIPPPPDYPPAYQDQPPGYIIYLATVLDQALDGAGLWTNLASTLGFPLPISDRVLFCHNVVEYAGDILILRADPAIGQKIMESAMVRTPSFWALLMRAFPHQYQPILKAAEDAFQQQMIQYGGLLMTQNETLIKQVMAVELAAFSIQYLNYKTGGNFTAFQSYLEGAVLGALDASIAICQGAGYMAEVDAAAAYVAAQLQARNITSKLLR